MGAVSTSSIRGARSIDKTGAREDVLTFPAHDVTRMTRSEANRARARIIERPGYTIQPGRYFLWPWRAARPA